MKRVALILVTLALVAVVVACKPIVDSPSATNVTHSTAKLNATVNPMNFPTTYYFEYGTTTSYGSVTTTKSLAAGSAAVAVSAVAQDLTPNTTYHYRVVATNSSPNPSDVTGTSQGADATFTTSTCSPGTPITITTGGTYSGCYVSTSTTTPAVTIDTGDLVELDHARVEHAGHGVYRAANGFQLNIHDSTFKKSATTPEALENAYAVYAWGATRFDFQNNLLVDGDGVFWSAGDGTVTQGSFLRNKIVNVGRYYPTELVHGFQTSAVDLAGLEVAWNEIHNTPLQSNIEDGFNFYDSNGTSTASWDIHHNLVDGLNPPVTGVSSFSGTGISLGDNQGSYMRAHHNIFVSSSCPGISTGHHMEIDNNVCVNDGYMNSVLTGDTDDSGISVWDNPFYSDHPANVSAHDNVIAFMRPVNSTTLERFDKWIPACAADIDIYDSADDTACPNASLSGTPDSTWEQTARNEWDRARIVAGMTTGPS